LNKPAALRTPFQNLNRWPWQSSPRARLLKIAARITETASRVRIAFAAACPEADLFRSIARSLQPAGP
jgi:Transposase DDE domain group 1